MPWAPASTTSGLIVASRLLTLAYRPLFLRYDLPHPHHRHPLFELDMYSQYHLEDALSTPTDIFSSFG